MTSDSYITTVHTAEGPSYAVHSPSNDTLILLTIKDAVRLQGWPENLEYRPLSTPAPEARTVAGTVFSSY